MKKRKRIKRGFKLKYYHLGLTQNYNGEVTS